MGSREWATLFWLAVVLIYCLVKRDIRQSLGQVVRQLAAPKLSVSLLLYVAVIAGPAWLMDGLGYWNSSLVGAVFFWFLFTGFRYYLQSADAARQAGYFREKLRELIGVAAFFEFFLNIRTFSIPAEIALVFVVTVLAMLQAFSASKEEYKPAHRLVSVILLAIVIWLVVATVRYLAHHWHDLKPHDVIASFLVPGWLTIVTLPYLYLLALVATYELVFLRMRAMGWELPAAWPAKLGVISKFGGRLRRLNAFNGMWPRRAGEAAGFKAARRVVDEFEAELKRPTCLPN